jgi:hypothetical protein
VKRCPENYPNKHVFFDGYDDTRTCSECTCAPPFGSMCSAMISVYTDGACQEPQAQNVVTSEPGFCVKIMPPDVALGSKSAGKATYTPGTCEASGGQASGDALAVGPSTFCCQ